MPNVIKCNKNDFWKKKGTIRERCFSPFAFSTAVYCNDQPNALDTAVRRCSYTLTLHVLNDSGRMNHVAEVDILHLSIQTIIAFFTSNRWVCFYFTQGASSRCGWPKAFYKCVKLLKDEAIISAIRFITKANWKINYTMLSNSTSRVCYQAHFPHYKMVLLITYLMDEKGDKFRWHTVWLWRLSYTLPKMIDLNFTFHCIASCFAFINQHIGFLWWQMHSGSHCSLCVFHLRQYHLFQSQYRLSVICLT